MNFKVINAFLFLILLIFYILTEFGFPLGNFVLPFYFAVCILFLLYYLIKYQSTFYNNFIALKKSKIGFWFRMFFIWIIIGIVFSIYGRTFLPKSFLSNFLGNFFCSVFFPFLLSTLALPFFVSYKKLCKYLLIIYFCVFLAGIVEFIANSLGLSFVQEIFKFILNRHALLNDLEKTFSQAYGHFRVAGVFGEPGALAAFTFISSPIIHYLCKTKTKLLNSTFTDFIVKKATLIMAILCFIGTQSPINLVFMGILLAFVLIGLIKKIRIKNKGFILFSAISGLIIVLIVLSSILSTKGIDISETYLNRIVKVSSALSSITELTYADPSLATRVANYYADIKIGLSHPLFGVGYGNINSVWPSVVKSLPIPITNEIMYYVYWGIQAGGASFLFKLIAETGFVGTALFFLFLFTTVKSVRKVKYVYSIFEQGFMERLKISLILYICISFYTALQPFYLIYFGILVSMILNAQKIQKQMQLETEENPENE